MAAKKAPAKKAPAKKAPAKKAPAKKAPAKKAPAKKAPAKKAPVKKAPAIKTRFNKTQILNSIAETTGLNRKQVAAVMDELETLVGRHISKNGAGEFILPGLLKIMTVKKPARKARKGINPFTGEETTFKAKPASIAVKIRPLKKVKEMATG